MGNKINYIEIGNKIREAREIAGLTQDKLATNLGWDRTTIIRIENAQCKVTLEQLIGLANELNLNLDDIIYNITDKDAENIKGIILAGGAGSRLYPLTKGKLSKQLVAVYDKPMIYYPISVLMQAHIKDILIITTPDHQEIFKSILDDGKKWGINLNYAIQPKPEGLAQALIIGEDFIGDNPCAMILGDNIFYGGGMKKGLYKAINNVKAGYATIFGSKVVDPKRFGIMELRGQNVISVEEKPKYPKSDYAITGLYFYPNGVSEKAKMVTPSARGELEITTLNDMYLQEQKLKAILMSHGDIWFDSGTNNSLFNSSIMIKSSQEQLNEIICCPEAIAYNNGWIKREDLERLYEEAPNSEYGQYILRLAKDGRKCD